MSFSRGERLRWTGRPGRRVLQYGAILLCGSFLLGLAVSYISLLACGTINPGEWDFLAYYGGADLVAAGHGAQLYNFAAQARVEAHVTYPLVQTQGLLPYIYPPYFAVALAPLSFLPYSAAYGVWCAINLALLALCISLLQGYMGLGKTGRLLFWLGGLSFLPVWLALAQGQCSLMLVLLFAASLRCLRTGHEKAAGALLAVALIKPQYVVPLAVLLLVQRRWRALTAFAVAGGLLALAPLAIVGWSGDLAYLHTLIQAAGWHTQFGYGPQGNQSLAGFVLLLVPVPGAGTVTAVLDVTAVGLLVYAARQWKDIGRLFALGVMVALLISPHVLIHDLSLLLVPVAVALRHRPESAALLALLSALYLAALIGIKTVSIVPLQLCVIGTTLLAVWLWFAPPALEQIERGSVGENPCLSAALSAS